MRGCHIGPVRLVYDLAWIVSPPDPCTLLFMFEKYPLACMLMTAHGTPDIINEATRLGFDYILLKPFTPSELRGAVDKVLASKG